MPIVYREWGGGTAVYDLGLLIKRLDLFGMSVFFFHPCFMFYRVEKEREKKHCWWYEKKKKNLYIHYDWWALIQRCAKKKKGDWVKRTRLLFFLLFQYVAIVCKEAYFCFSFFLPFFFSKRAKCNFIINALVIILSSLKYYDVGTINRWARNKSVSLAIIGRKNNYALIQRVMKKKKKVSYRRDARI